MRTSSACYVVSIAILSAACGSSNDAPQQIDIVAWDYAYQIPAIARPGPAHFRLINRGQHLHEVQLYRFRPGIRADSALRLLAMDEYPDSLADEGGAVLVAVAGDTTASQVYAVLDTSRVWALVCAFRDSVGAIKHNKMGMIAVLSVRP